MKRAFAVILFASTAMPSAAQSPEMRCGWFTNPTPGNAWLRDAHGEWTIAAQGGHQAEGDWPPEGYGKGQWVTHGHASYGYGCACFRVVVDAEQKRVIKILSAKARPLSACRDDAALKRAEKALSE